MKPFAEFVTINNMDYNTVHPVSGEMAGEHGPENYNCGQEKYSMKKLNLSLHSLPVNDLYDLILASGYSCERKLYSSALYVQCGSCFVVYHVDFFFAFVKYLDGG